MEGPFYSITPLKDCTFGGMTSVRMMKAVERITAGPLDVCGGQGLHPIYMISSGEDYYLLEVENENRETHFVGFVEMSHYKKSTQFDDLKFCINRFEIFREFRGNKYGEIFAKKLMRPETFAPHEIGSKCVGVEICQMNGSSFIFWWKAVKTYILDDMFTEVFGFDGEGDGNVDKYVNVLCHEDIVKRILKGVVEEMKKRDEWTNEDAIAYVESMEDYKKCVEYVENTRCHICFTFHTRLAFTVCGGNCHEEGCRYKYMCENCCDLVIQGEGECPGRCRDGKIRKLRMESVYSI